MTLYACETVAYCYRSGRNAWMPLDCVRRRPRGGRLGGAVIRDPGDGADVALVRLHDYRLAAFRPGDPVSAEMLAHLHRSPGLKAKLGLTVLGGPAPLSRAVARLRPAPAETRALVAELLGELHGFLDDDVVSYAMSLNEPVDWSMSAVRRAADTVFVTARTRGRRVVTDQAAFLRELEPVCPVEIVAPHVVRAGEGGRWSMLAVTEVPSASDVEAASLQELLPYLHRLRETGSREVTHAEALGGLEAAFGEDIAPARRLLSCAGAKAGAASLSLCRAHGDFVPWNMGLAQDRLHLWDWSRAMAEAPWPYDAIHHCFQSRRHVRGEEREAALQGALGDIVALARELGVAPGEASVRRMFVEYAAYRSANEHRVETVGSDTEWLEKRACELL